MEKSLIHLQLLFEKTAVATFRCIFRLIPLNPASLTCINPACSPALVCIVTWGRKKKGAIRQRRGEERERTQKKSCDVVVREKNVCVVRNVVMWFLILDPAPWMASLFFERRKAEVVFRLFSAISGKDITFNESKITAKVYKRIEQRALIHGSRSFS